MFWNFFKLKFKPNFLSVLSFSLTEPYRLSFFLILFAICMNCLFFTTPLIFSSYFCHRSCKKEECCHWHPGTHRALRPWTTNHSHSRNLIGTVTKQPAQVRSQSLLLCYLFANEAGKTETLRYCYIGVLYLDGVW